MTACKMHCHYSLNHVVPNPFDFLADIKISSTYIFSEQRLKLFKTSSLGLAESAARDFGKENVRKLREIQRRFRELEAQREHAKPVPVKALWTSPKYQDVSSRVMAQLQVSSSGPK